MIDRFEQVNGVRIHYLDRPGAEPPIVMLPGLTANAHSFDGLMAAGLSPQFRTIALDLRGRGDSDKPATGYTLADHAADVIALLDRLELSRAVLLGHSFGGLLTIYLAANYPERVARAILVDVALWVVDDVAQLIQGSVDRLSRTLPSEQAYIDAIKAAPYVNGFWDATIESYYRAEIEVNPDGTAHARTSAAAIVQVLEAVRDEPWSAYVKNIVCPATLINAPGAFGPPGTPAIVPENLARQTAEAIAGCQYIQVPGNHLTMVFGANAPHVVRVINGFLSASLW